MFKRKRIHILDEGESYYKAGYTHTIPLFDFVVDLVISKPFATFIDDGCVVHEGGRNTALVWLNEENAKDVVIHESVHIAQAVCRTIAPEETCVDGHTRNELMAHLTDHIAAQIFKAIGVTQ